MTRVHVIIPAWNEADTIADVVQRLFRHRAALEGRGCMIERVIVVDNNSTDRTAIEAKQAGAHVVSEFERGYGAACLRGLQAAEDAEIIVFIDGDGSDVPAEWPSLVLPLLEDTADLVIGSRIIGKADAKALPTHQRFGNLLASFLLNIRYGTELTDLGPFRAIKKETLDSLQMVDRNFGWTIEMQVKALRQHLRIREVGVTYRPRQGGDSKISGTVTGSLRAGFTILSIIGKEYRTKVVPQNRVNE